VFSNSLPISGQWQFLCYVNTPNTTSFYLDGVLVSSQNSNTLDLNCSLHGLYFGLDIYQLAEYYSGTIDDVGVWNRALDSTEISELFLGSTLELSNNKNFNDIQIWPNPSNDHITIDAGNLATMNGYSIKIEDAQGQQVFQNAVNQQLFYVDITTWGGNGLYFVRIIDPQGNTVDIKKIVLQ
jgi:hypothetical protein